MALRDVGLARSQLSLERKVEVTDTAHLSLDLLPILADLHLVTLHAFVHFLEIVPLLIEIPVLLSQDLLVFVEEVSEFVELAILEDLEPVESGRDLIRRRNLRHLCDRLVQQVMLAFH